MNAGVTQAQPSAVSERHSGPSEAPLQRLKDHCGLEPIAGEPPGRFRLFGYENDCTDEDLAMLKEVPKLSEVILYDGFSNRGLEYLRGLDQLEVLVLCYNSKITDDGLAPLASLRNLKALHLQGAYFHPDSPHHADFLTERGLRYLKGLGKLQLLVLRGQRLGDSGLENVSGLRNLRVLKMQGGKTLTDAALAHVAGLTALEELAVSSRSITGEGLRFLRGLSALRRLKIYSRALKDTELAHLQELPNLTTLDLEDSNVSDAGLAYVKSFQSLKTVKLGGTSVTESGKQSLQAALPVLTIK